jgi:hypothetical protein
VDTAQPARSLRGADAQGAGSLGCQAGSQSARPRTRPRPRTRTRTYARLSAPRAVTAAPATAPGAASALRAPGTPRNAVGMKAQGLSTAAAWAAFYSPPPRFLRSDLVNSFVTQVQLRFFAHLFQIYCFLPISLFSFSLWSKWLQP